MIFRVIWTDHITPGEHAVEWFVMADTKKEAIALARKKQAAKNGIEAKEWSYCQAPQHAEIPAVPSLDHHARQVERAVMVHDGVPYCQRCIEHKYAAIADRVERLERAFCGLQDDFYRHTGSGHS
jgi:hypothetical protein